MGLKGPLSLAPRPLTKVIITIDQQTGMFEFNFVGPLGFRRPFAKINPVPSDRRMLACLQSRAANDFAKGLAEGGFSSLDADDLESAKKDWCRGILKTTSDPADELFPPLELVDDSMFFEATREDMESLPDGEIKDAFIELFDRAEMRDEVDADGTVTIKPREIQSSQTGGKALQVGGGGPQGPQRELELAELPEGE